VQNATRSLPVSRSLLIPQVVLINLIAVSVTKLLNKLHSEQLRDPVLVISRAGLFVLRF
jgi:hypothetical protein